MRLKCLLFMVSMYLPINSIPSFFISNHDILFAHPLPTIFFQEALGADVERFYVGEPGYSFFWIKLIKEFFQDARTDSFPKKSRINRKVSDNIGPVFRHRCCRSPCPGPKWRAARTLSNGSARPTRDKQPTPDQQSRAARGPRFFLSAES